LQPGFNTIVTMNILRGSTFILRPWLLSDEESLIKYADNENVSRYLADRFPYPYTLQDAQSWLNYIVGAKPIINFTIDIDGEASGGIGVELKTGERRKTAHLGYWLGEPFWGCGIVPEATKLMVDYIFGNFDIVRIETVVYHPNTASMRVLEKCGFIKEGIGRKAIYKNGELYDEHVYAIIK
jgi:ribosomal-protein-alanine N-acetyltransferase